MLKTGVHSSECDGKRPLDANKPSPAASILLYVNAQEEARSLFINRHCAGNWRLGDTVPSSSSLFVGS